MTTPDPVTPATSDVRRQAKRPDPDPATRRLVIESAVACILERGFYRASSNEIARRAGVTWGVIQHYFGTREGLMLAVLQDGARKFEELFESATIEGETPSERLEQLLDVLAKHYGTPEYLAFLQVMLNLDHDPTTSPGVRTTMRTLAELSSGQVRRRLQETLGPAADVPEVPLTIFLALKGFVLSQRLLVNAANDTVPPMIDGVAHQRTLLSQILAPYLEQAAAG